MFQYITDYRNSSSIMFDFFFVEWSRQSQPQIPNIRVPRSYWDLRNESRCHLADIGPGRCRQLDVDMIIKYFFCLNYGIRNTSARWIVRIDDDTLVNFAKLGKYIQALEARHNPLSEFVLKGHCIGRRTWAIFRVVLAFSCPELLQSMPWITKFHSYER
jgi:hypothetical protein